MATEAEKIGGMFSHAVLITPADLDLTEIFQSLWVGGVGNVRVTTANGDDVLFTAVPAGTRLPVKVKRVWATNTTATLIVGLSNPALV